MQKQKALIITLSILLFIISLTQDAINYIDFDGTKNLSSISALLSGALSILGGGMSEWLIWLANPIYLLALILFIKFEKLSLIISIVANLIALSFIFWTKILVAENGRLGEIYHLKTGYWLWLISLTTLTFGIFYILEKVKSKGKSHNRR